MWMKGLIRFIRRDPRQDHDLHKWSLVCSCHELPFTTTLKSHQRRTRIIRTEERDENGRPKVFLRLEMILGSKSRNVSRKDERNGLFIVIGNCQKWQTGAIFGQVENLAANVCLDNKWDQLLDDCCLAEAAESW